jgi:hypothetical protein
VAPISVSIHASGFDHFVQIVGLILSIITISIVVAAFGNLKVAKKAMRYDLRPYISFKEFAFRTSAENSSPNDLWEVQVLWQNTGKSFTQNMHNQLFVNVVPIGTEHELGFRSISGLSEKELQLLSVPPSGTMGGRKRTNSDSRFD